jgi:hypothetical protein
MAAENTRIVFWDNGGVQVLIPAPKHVALLMEQGMTEQEAVESIRDSDVPETATDVEITDTTMIDEDRTFRNAWQIDKAPGRQKVTKVHMAKARAIWMQKIRNSRRFALRDQDIESRRAFEEQDDTKRAAVAAEKQRLRDLPQTFNLGSAQNPNALKALWPPGLLREEDIFQGLEEGTLNTDGIGQPMPLIKNEDVPF